jgi:hypothetical protein
MGVCVAWANRSSCLSVGSFVPSSHSSSAGNRDSSSPGAQAGTLSCPAQKGAADWNPDRHGRLPGQRRWRPRHHRGDCQGSRWYDTDGFLRGSSGSELIEDQVTALRGGPRCTRPWRPPPGDRQCRARTGNTLQRCSERPILSFGGLCYVSCNVRKCGQVDRAGSAGLGITRRTLTAAEMALYMD